MDRSHGSMQEMRKIVEKKVLTIFNPRGHPHTHRRYRPITYHILNHRNSICSAHKASHKIQLLYTQKLKLFFKQQMLPAIEDRKLSAFLQSHKRSYINVCSTLKLLDSKDAEFLIDQKRAQFFMQYLFYKNSISWIIRMCLSNTYLQCL